MFGQNARRTALAENRQNLTETPIKPALNIDTPNVGTKIWEFETGWWHGLCNNSLTCYRFG